METQHNNKGHLYCLFCREEGGRKIKIKQKGKTQWANKNTRQIKTKAAEKVCERVNDIRGQDDGGRAWLRHKAKAMQKATTVLSPS